MTERRNRTYIEYPMDFSNPNGEKMRPILDGVGLAGDTVNEMQRSKKVRSTLVARGLLFAMMRPTATGGRSPAHAYLHPAYTQAAFRGVPDLRDSRGSAFWLREVVPHLQTFAVGHEAQTLISEGIVTHCNRIADQTLKLPHSGDDPWIPAYETADGVDPMALMGVTARRVELSSYRRDVHKDMSDHGRTYYRMMGVAGYIGWTIPGIDTQETRTAILDAFQTTANPERAADPYALFMAGKVAIENLEVQLSEIEFDADV